LSVFWILFFALVYIVLGAVLVAVVGFGLAPFLGAPFLPILAKEVDGLLDLADLNPGQSLIDLGSGDGRLLKAAAKKGIRGVGYEINPWLCLIAVINCWQYRSLVTIKWQNYWTVRLPEADAIYVFLIQHYMGRLDRKLSREVTKPTKLVSFVFAVPGRVAVKKSRNSFLYLYPKGEG
jgi:hypothetical protein